MSSPQVLRRIEVPANIKLDRLHLTLQAALGWTNSHLYEIRARDTRWGLPDPGWPDGPLDARKAKLIDVLEDAGANDVEATTLRYLYDFGDSWEHTITIERMLAPEPDVVYPRLVEATGGPWSYAEMLDALDDPQHERHAEIREWIGDDFDPNTFDPNSLNAEVAALAKRWSRKPSAKKKPRIPLLAD